MAFSDFIRVPLPAHNTTAARGAVMAAITRDAGPTRQPRAGPRGGGRTLSGRAATETDSVWLCTVIPNVGLRKSVVTGSSGCDEDIFTVIGLAFMFPPASHNVLHRMPSPVSRSNS